MDCHSHTNLSFPFSGSIQLGSWPLSLSPLHSALVGVLLNGLGFLIRPNELGSGRIKDAVECNHVILVGVLLLLSSVLFDRVVFVVMSAPQSRAARLFKPYRALIYDPVAAVSSFHTYTYVLGLDSVARQVVRQRPARLPFLTAAAGGARRPNHSRSPWTRTNRHDDDARMCSIGVHMRLLLATCLGWSPATLLFIIRCKYVGIRITIAMLGERRRMLNCLAACAPPLLRQPVSCLLPSARTGMAQAREKCFALRLV